MGGQAAVRPAAAAGLLEAVCPHGIERVALPLLTVLQLRRLLAGPQLLDYRHELIYLQPTMPAGVSTALAHNPSAALAVCIQPLLLAAAPSWLHKYRSGPQRYKRRRISASGRNKRVGKVLMRHLQATARWVGAAESRGGRCAAHLVLAQHAALLLDEGTELARRRIGRHHGHDFRRHTGAEAGGGTTKGSQRLLPR